MRSGLQTGTISITGKRKRVEASRWWGCATWAVRSREDPRGLLQRCTSHCVERIHGGAGRPDPAHRGARCPHRALTTVAVLAYAIADALGLPTPSAMDILRAGYLADIGMEIVLRTTSSPTSSRVARGSEYEAARRSIPRRASACSAPCGPPERARAGDHPREPRSSWTAPATRSDRAATPFRSVSFASSLVADAYDALTSWRPYRDPLARDARSLDEIQRELQPRHLRSARGRSPLKLPG